MQPIPTDHRRARGEATQHAIMRATENLIANKGLAAISIRDIVIEAGQKNESALQYHFTNFEGLLAAIHQQRALQIRAQREILMTEILATSDTPTLQQVCLIMVKPAYDLAQSNPDFCNYLKAFGHELVLTESSPSGAAASGGAGGKGGQQLASQLKHALPHLSADTFVWRIDAAVRLASASMYHQARRQNGFRGKQGKIFLLHLVDALEGLLSAPVSKFMP